MNGRWLAMLAHLLAGPLPPLPTPKGRRRVRCRP
jgi:hypothetical protein